MRGNMRSFVCELLLACLRHKILQIAGIHLVLRLVTRWANRRITVAVITTTMLPDRLRFVGESERQQYVAVHHHDFLLECWPIEVLRVCSFPPPQPTTPVFYSTADGRCLHNGTG